MGIKLETTGTLSPVEFDDLGLTLTHSTTINNLLDDFTILDILEANELQAAIEAGHVVLTTDNNDVITNLSGDSVIELVNPLSQQVANIQDIVNTTIINGQLNPIGQDFFSCEGQLSTTPKWFTAATRNGMPSNLAPVVSPANVACVSITMTNERNNGDGEIEVYVNGTNVYTWSIVDARMAHNNAPAGSPFFKMNAGDGLSVRGKLANGGGGDDEDDDDGGSSQQALRDIRIVFYFRMIADGTPGEYKQATL